jgi:hypothetical protein
MSGVTLLQFLLWPGGCVVCALPAGIHVHTRRMQVGLASPGLNPDLTPASSAPLILHRSGTDSVPSTTVIVSWLPVQQQPPVLRDRTSNRQEDNPLVQQTWSSAEKQAVVKVGVWSQQGATPT